ncbi:MAG TPA: beta-ketothiolase BktB [Chloroflexia bacterium]
MAEEREIVVLSGVRTAVGKYGGSLKDFSPTDLGGMVIKEAVRRSGLEPGDIGHVVFGNILHTDSGDMYGGRLAMLKAGLPIEVPALTLNRLCGSGLQAIVTASHYIKLGYTDAAVAGGMEVMSRAQYWLPGMRWGQRMNDATVIDSMVAVLTDPQDGCHMGITAERVATKYNISREDQDALAVESHRRAVQAIDNGYFREQILPIEIKTKAGVTVFDTDEGPRRDANTAAMAKLKPAFDKTGSVTAGNASSINDAASAVVLMERKAAEARGLRPLGRLVADSVAAVDPKYMGIGPVPAVRALLERTGLTIKDMDVIELNEAFAAQALGVIRELDLPMDRTNPNGSGISLGHPVGASGAILTVKALNELQRTGGRYALVTLCIGGGQGIAAIYERL